VYEKCLQWLHNLSISDLETSKPSFIQADHRVQARTSVHVMFQHKQFSINLSEQGNDTKIHINIYRIPNFRYPPQKEKSQRYRMFWIDYVVNLLRYLGVYLRTDDLKRFYPVDYIKKRISERQNRYLTFGIIYLALSFMVVFAGDGTSVLYRISLLGFTFIVFFVILIMYFSVIDTRFSKIFRIQENPWWLMMEIYPDKVADNVLIRNLAKMPL
jgi:hypothetical protein